MISVTLKQMSGAVYFLLVVAITVSNIVYFYSASYPAYLPGNLEQLEMLTKNSIFEGRWAIDKPFSQLKHNYGRLRATFKNYSPDTPNSRKVYKILRLVLFDSKFYDSNYLLIDLVYETNVFLSSNIKNQGNESLPFGGSLVHYIDGEKFGAWNLGLTGTFKFTEALLTNIKGTENAINTKNFFTSQSLIKGSVNFSGPSQANDSLWEGSSPKINFNLAYDITDWAVQSYIFYVWMTSVFMLSIYGSLYILSKARNDPDYMASISFTSLFLACVWDYCFFYLNIYLALVFFEPCGYLILFMLSVLIVFVLDFMVLLHRIPKRLFEIVPRFFAAILLWIAFSFALNFAIYVLSYVIFRQWFLVINGLILIPQIIENFYKNEQTVFDTTFAKYFCMAKFGYFFYIRFFSHNIVGREPDYGLITLAISFLYLSMKVLEWQAKYGSRNSIPKIVDDCLKKWAQKRENARMNSRSEQAPVPTQTEPVAEVKPAEYWQSFELFQQAPVPSHTEPVAEAKPAERWQNFEQSHLNLEHSINIMSENSVSMNLCKICLTNIDKSEEPQQSNPSSGNRRRGRKTTAKTSMKTSCGHEFHTECIRLWIENSKECPSCRELIEYLPA